MTADPLVLMAGVGRATRRLVQTAAGPDDAALVDSSPPSGALPHPPRWK